MTIANLGPTTRTATYQRTAEAPKPSALSQRERDQLILQGQDPAKHVGPPPPTHYNTDPLPVCLALGGAIALTAIAVFNCLGGGAGMWALHAIPVWGIVGGIAGGVIGVGVNLAERLGHKLGLLHW